MSQERNVLGRLLGSLGLEISPLRGSLIHSVTTTPCGCIMSLSVGSARALATDRTQQAQCSRPGVSVFPPGLVRSYGRSPPKATQAMPGHDHASCVSISVAWGCVLGVRRAGAAAVQPAGEPGKVRMQSDTKHIHAWRPKPSWRCAGSSSTDGTVWTPLSSGPVEDRYLMVTNAITTGA